MERDLSGMMDGNLELIFLPGDVLRNIFFKCAARDLGRLSQTCRYFQELISDDLLWRHLCWRDFNLYNPDLGPIESYHLLYRNLLHNYGWMFGVYLSCIGHYGGLSEIRYKSGAVECVNWEPEDPVDVEAPLVEEIVFQIRGDTVPPVILCFPDEPSMKSHLCAISFNKVKGSVTQQCLDSKFHRDRLMEQNKELMNQRQYKFTFSQFRTMLLFYCIEIGLHHKPILLPSRDDVPDELKLTDGSVPQQLITPGLFKGFFSVHNVTGVQILCFRYKNECEILGLKVAGEANNDDDGICLKIFVRHSLSPSLEEQESFDALLESDHEAKPLGKSQTQPFRVPIECETLGTYPSTCKARYNGFMRVRRKSYYLRVHVVIFSDDLIGVLMLDYQKTFQTYQRIHQKFTPNMLTEVESVI